LKLSHIGARASITTVSVGFPGELREGPLSRLTYIGRIWRLFEADGELTENQQAKLVEAMSNTRVARTLVEGLRIEERLVCRSSGEGRRKPAPKSPFHDTDEYRRRVPEGQKEESVLIDSWRVSAAALDDETCLLKNTGAMTVVGREVESRRGPTPEELLLGALAGCTTIYVARNAALNEIPAESVRVFISAEIPDDPSEPIGALDKVCEVVGELTGKEVSDLEHMARYCAIGETLQRGVEFVDDESFKPTPAAAVSAQHLAALTREAPKPADPAFCDDGACCVPE
jgi:uncharacterized OsmC-like protein